MPPNSMFLSLKQCYKKNGHGGAMADCGGGPPSAIDNTALKLEIIIVILCLHKDNAKGYPYLPFLKPCK